MDFKDAHILSTKQFSREDIDKIMDTAEEMASFAQKGKKTDLLQGKILATLFFEPSTRTRFSFETAMIRLGGNVITNWDMMRTSSVTKQETLYDTAQVVSRFADVIVIRHPKAGSVKEFSKGSLVPIINAGDGPADHPTQALLDLYTILKAKNTVDGLKIGMVGDLKYSRVVHSECDLFKHYKDVEFYLVSPDELKMPREIVDFLKEKGFKVTETSDLESVVGEFDILSDTRIQEERFSDLAEYERLKGCYCVNAELLKRAKDDMIVIAPLPRVDELSIDIDGDSRSKYFEQVADGVVVRMALLCLVLGVR